MADDSKVEKIKSMVRTVPDFPKEGILFYDITTVLKDKEGLNLCIETMYDSIKDLKIDKVVGIESRGFIFGVPLALKLGCGFIPIRKKGKLPAEKVSEAYSLEYGTNIIEMHNDAVENKENILLVDDLLATGGTASAACKLIEQAGGKVISTVFLVELTFLEGREILKGYDVKTILKYDN